MFFGGWKIQHLEIEMKRRTEVFFLYFMTNKKKHISPKPANIPIL